jgi:hypothetical protein
MKCNRLHNAKDLKAGAFRSVSKEVMFSRFSVGPHNNFGKRSNDLLILTGVKNII